MALTSEQEAIVLQIITAFQNGKRLNELPEAGGVNPFDLIVEVLDTDGESKQSKLATLLPYLEEQCAYGVDIGVGASPDLDRAGNINLCKSLPLQTRMKGCLLDDDGKVVEYLNRSDWRAHDRSGARGQVMVELPGYYYKFWTDDTILKARISEYPLPGYHYQQKQYVSAYEATRQSSTSKLCSVVNVGADFRGGNNNAEWDNTYRTLLGRPVSEQGLNPLRMFARNRNPNTSEWNTLTYGAYKTLVWFFMIEYATRNSQKPFMAAKDPNGYAQGGLGNGATTFVDWSGFNASFPVLPCGYTDALCNSSGEMDYDVTREDGSVTTVKVNRYRGVENPFGHLGKFMDGVYIKVIDKGEGNRDAVAFVCEDPALFAAADYINLPAWYEARGYVSVAAGFVKNILFGEHGDILPTTGGASSGTYYCDYHGAPVLNHVFVKPVAMIEAFVSGASAGFFALNLDATANPPNRGTRLCFIPNM
jgi:hypothetical protein